MNVIEDLECEVIDLPEPAFPWLEDEGGGGEAIYLTWFTEFHQRAAICEPQA